VSDVEALDWLDRLLAANEPQRRASLATLEQDDPELHARLERLLINALATENSRVLAAPVLDGVARLNVEVTRTLQPGDVLAGYRLIRELGRGGMSVVWLAERADGVVRRAVALKMPMFMLQGGDVERFARERDALAALSHANVARLYDAGVLPSGQPFIVLEHVDGLPFTVHCDAQRLDLRARLRLFLQVLGAVEHAHKHLIVHRDLKPSNILVNAEGQVKLLDFGIAKLLGENEGAAPLTEMVGAAMTPLYAAPEQLRGATISTLTDVYSLGVVLHELLTGALPYRSAGVRASLVEVLDSLGRGTLPCASHAVIDDAAAIARGRASPAKLRGELAGDLDTIVGKALRIAPDDRYGSAAHLADDLKRYLDQKPIAARPPSFWYATRLAITRHRLAASVAGVGLTLVAGASFVAWTQYRESRAHAERTAAVRDFMFELVNDAEASEGQQGEITGRQMVDGAVARARRDFVAQPQLQGELLGELGRMYLRLDAAEAAVPVLEESVTVLERHAPPDDPALNKGRAFLADALMRTGDDLPQIRALATLARDACSSADVECAKARAYGGSFLSQLASFAGDDEGALGAMRRSAADTEFAFGARHEETAMAFMSLAITARNAGHLIEAGTAMRRAVAAAQDLRMRAADRTSLDRTMALIDFDLGHYAAACDRLIALQARPVAAAESALQSRLLATVYIELGDATNALQSADAAIAQLAGQDDAASALPYAQQIRARALALANRPEEALAQVDEVLRQLLALGRASNAIDVLRASRYRAEFLIAAGRVTQGLQLLRELRAQHAGGGTSPIEHGLLLDALGSAEIRAGNAEAARVAHEAAQVELARQLPADHPFLKRNAALRIGA
jgi:eukaryotic-like serine/threonine-protein kinase